MSAVDLKLPFEDRAQAGRLLAEALADLGGAPELLVLALPRGGVPVAAELARRLDGRLDLLLVRKLGVPGQPELAMGAIASGGVRVLNPDIVDLLGIEPDTLDAVAQTEARELERRDALYRGGRPLPEIRRRRVVLVDDGVATGATMRAAVQAVRVQKPAELTVAVPVASAEAVALLRPSVDRLAVLAVPEPFIGVGRWYRAFPQVADGEVRRLLERVRWERGQPGQSSGGARSGKDGRNGALGPGSGPR